MSNEVWAFLVLKNYSNHIDYIYNNQPVPYEYKKAIKTVLGPKEPLQEKKRNSSGFGDEVRKLKWKMGSKAQVCKLSSSKATNRC